MDNLLVLLTNYFPFYKGEEYLENELPIISREFKKIIIISCMIDDTYKQTRRVPENVEIIRGGVSHSKIGKTNMIIKSLGNKPKEVRKLSYAQKFYSKYFEQRSMMIYENVKKDLILRGIVSYRKVTIYSYWTYITARIGIEINSELLNKSAKIISRAHGYDLYENVSRLNFLPEREYIFENIENIFPVSDNGTNMLKQNFPRYSSKFETRRLGTLDPKFSIVPKEFNKHLEIVSCSTVRNLKRINYIIDALEILQKRKIKVKWTHIGSGPIFRDIQKYAESKLLPNTFKLTGAIPNSKVIGIYESLEPDLFLNVSESEGVPVSIMEALSVGIPVLATNVGGTNEIVKNEYNGFLLNKETNGSDIASNIELFMNLNRYERKKLSENARKFWGETYDAEKNYNDFLNDILIEG